MVFLSISLLILDREGNTSVLFRLYLYLVVGVHIFSRVQR